MIQFMESAKTNRLHQGFGSSKQISIQPLKLKRTTGKITNLSTFLKTLLRQEIIFFSLAGVKIG